MSRPVFETFNSKWAERVIGRVSRSGIDSYLGIEAVACEPGRMVCEMAVTDELITVMGTMHGGCLSALCDHVLGLVMYPIMPPGYWAATTEFKINLLAPVTGGVCTAAAEVISMSKRQAVVRVEITNEPRSENAASDRANQDAAGDDAADSARLVAVAQGTTTIVAPKTGT